MEKCSITGNNWWNCMKMCSDLNTWVNTKNQTKQNNKPQSSAEPLKTTTHMGWNYICLAAPEIKAISNRRALRDKGLLWPVRSQLGNGLCQWKAISGWQPILCQASFRLCFWDQPAQICTLRVKRLRVGNPAQVQSHALQQSNQSPLKVCKREWHQADGLLSSHIW